MTENEAAERLTEIMKAIAVCRGDTVYLGVDMSALPLPSYPAKITADTMRLRAEKWCAFLFNCLTEYLGPEGTLIVPTFTYGCAAPGQKFIHEETPSDVGPFTEYIRRHPKAVRSLHPIFSLAGIGKHAADILFDTGKSAFGPLSAFGRLTKNDVKFLCLGVPLALSITYLHHLEQMHGCNHRYNKVLESKVVRNGREVEGPWLAYLRYRGVSQGPDFSRFEDCLREEGVLLETGYKGFPYQCVKVSEVDEIGYRALYGNPCAFASHDVEVRLDESASARNPVVGHVAEFVLRQKEI